MGRRLQCAAAIGRAPGVLIRLERPSGNVSGADNRLKLAAGTIAQAVYLLNGHDGVVAGTVLQCLRDVETAPGFYSASPLRTASL
jgi:hypothetical protein